MNSLREAIDRIEARERSLEVHTADEEAIQELRNQFATRNVAVTQHRPTNDRAPDFAIVRGPDGAFQGSLRLDTLEMVLSPEIRPPWKLEESVVAATGLFDFLAELVFTSFDRRQMLATAREIEERAWRVNAGKLYAGFQRAAAFGAQLPVYDRFAADRNVSVAVLIEDEWHEGEIHPGIELVTDGSDEIGQFWFVIFDGGGEDLHMCGLLAEERAPGRFYGCWTYDPDRLDELISYLESTYLDT